MSYARGRGMMIRVNGRRRNGRNGLGAAVMEYSIPIAATTVKPPGGPPPAPYPKKTARVRALAPRLPVSRLGFGDDIEKPTVADPIDEIRATTLEILKRQKAESESRKIGWIIAGASALFAAAKLGLVAIPLIRSRIRPPTP